MNNIKKYRELHGMKQIELCKIFGVSQGTISGWENGKHDPKNEILNKMANLFGVSVDELLGNDKKTASDITSNAVFLEENHVFLIPVYESVSAGFGASANDEIIDQLPLYITNITEARETICIRVKGDSMYPKIENGDLIQVHKQDAVDSGSIAVVLLDGDEGLVKTVVFGKNWIELRSINPMYPPIRLEGADALKIRIVGLVKKIIKDV